MASTGPRYFGFVIGGALDAATAADVLTTGWDQNAFNVVSSPGAALVEDVAGGWLKDLLGLPDGASFGFVTGGQAANRSAWPPPASTCWPRPAGTSSVVACTGRRRCGWWPAPSGTSRSTAPCASSGWAPTPSGRSRPGPGGDRRGRPGPGAGGRAGRATIVCLQAGNVNSGACDDLLAAAAVAHEHAAWVHVDGAFGLWAAASPATRHLVQGIESADSWAADGHKWLNVPYDSGYAFCAHPRAHQAAMSFTAAYLTGQGAGGPRAPGDYVLESSRRARGFATWAALRELGRTGVDGWSTGAAPWPGASPSSSARPTASPSSTTSCSTRSWSVSVPTRRRTG